jgi:hypothetical protein
MNIFKRARIRYLLHRHAIPHHLWLEVTEQLALLGGLTAVEKAHLRELATLFLHEKVFSSVQGLELSKAMCLNIAVQACLPVLGLGLGCLSGWTEIIVYPSAFRVIRDSMDAVGVIHHEEQALAGESWLRGPIVLSWDDIEQDRVRLHEGHNVIIHEIAHKLDMLNGSANGFPPLHYDMDIAQWSASLETAYQVLVKRLEHHHHPWLSEYAATSPAEFFAVMSEYFFCAPELLHAQFAEVYVQFTQYYRQDPLQRMSAKI